ncbi:hypothetical protein [Enterovirga rhinocerotis]|uniref:Uncharacterized protein n=1 Tax=Enterovirga rhinocerotis TaxID=1339210 RepID=A0A4R7BWL9_9HYPH|nr:hypothetical protein [Enterovirga rhinocerotis]TDR90280.1 hypothetical protein EV668_3126 [Enterovirga rhinocerotis]
MLWIVDERGSFVASYDAVPYPAPEETLDRLRQRLDPNNRVVDVPPLGPEYWHAPDGVPVPKQQIAVTADRTSVQADENDEVVLQAVPAGSIVEVHGADGLTTIPAEQEGPISLTFSVAGPHVVRVTHPSHTERRFELEVTEATTVRRQRRIKRAVASHLVGPQGAAVAAKALAVLTSEGVPATAAALAAVAQRPEAAAALEGRQSSGIAAMAAAAGRSAEEVAQAIVETADAYWFAAAKHETLKARLTGLVERPVRKAEVERVIVEAGRADILPRL